MKKHLPRQIQSTDATEGNRWNQYIMATSLFQGQIWKEGEERVECLAER